MNDLKTKLFENTIGMKFVRIEPGTFLMGSHDGDLDERPVHPVKITNPFHMGVTVVTNREYERFAPSHAQLRGARGFSAGDDEAVVQVSWKEAVSFCEWLTEKEGLPYRLPTEAEWEYACRGGTQTAYYTGKTLPEIYHRNQKMEWAPSPVSLKVGTTPANAFGLQDMHGIVEEWCHDWYGPYTNAEQENPVGYAGGDFKVTRGGSHNAEVVFLRSANRSGTLPEDRSWIIGFRVVVGSLPKTQALPRPCRPLWADRVVQLKSTWQETPPTPVFENPIPYIHHPQNPETVPFYKHNHCPSVTWCDNGDLLAVWFSCQSEKGREMTILGSRLRAGNKDWDQPSEFFKAPDRNMTGSSLFNDGKGTLFHFNGLEATGGWANLALVMRTSTDQGASWGKPRLISPDHRLRNQVISGTSLTVDGAIIQPCDADYRNEGGTALHISYDHGTSWVEYGFNKPAPTFSEGGTGATIAGIHAGVVSLKDGRLMALGRGNNIKEKMPMSISSDGGRTWTYHASEFPPLSWGQRLVLMRLREGPLLLLSFTDTSGRLKNDEGTFCREKFKGLWVKDARGNDLRIHGLFAALSHDEGLTWPVKKLIAPEEGEYELEGGACTGKFKLERTWAEPMGYLAATQSPDGMIHLTSSRLYYKFNLTWIQRPIKA